MGIKFIDEKLCIGCEICVKVCPEDVLQMDKGGKLARIVYLKDCMSCYLCEIECPVEAIEVSPERVREVPLAW